jgi:hypothetical protein
VLGMQAEKPSPRLNFLNIGWRLDGITVHYLFLCVSHGLDVEGNWIRIWLGAAFRFRMIPLWDGVVHRRI